MWKMLVDGEWMYWIDVLVYGDFHQSHPYPSLPCPILPYPILPCPALPCVSPEVAQTRFEA